MNVSIEQPLGPARWKPANPRCALPATKEQPSVEVPCDSIVSCSQSNARVWIYFCLSSRTSCSSSKAAFLSSFTFPCSFVSPSAGFISWGTLSAGISCTLFTCPCMLTSKLKSGSWRIDLPLYSLDTSKWSARRCSLAKVSWDQHVEEQMVGDSSPWTESSSHPRTDDQDLGE
eukprot:136112-Amphidinium_carterae.1